MRRWLYQASARAYPSRLPELAYPAGAQLRRVSQQGSVKWKGGRTFLSEVLAREWVGLLEVQEDLREVYYGPLLWGRLDTAGDEPTFVADPVPPRRTRRGGTQAAIAGGRP